MSLMAPGIKSRFILISPEMNVGSSVTNHPDAPNLPFLRSTALASYPTWNAGPSDVRLVLKDVESELNVPEKLV